MGQCTFTSILKEELVTAQGCTEPIAIAYAAAKAREVLGDFPNKMVVWASGNIIKNVKSVTVPHSGGLKGIEASAVLGAFGGQPDLCLEVLSKVSRECAELARKKLESGICCVKRLETGCSLHLIVEVSKDGNTVSVEIMNLHDNITRIVKNGNTVFEKVQEENKFYGVCTPRDCLSFDSIYDFATNCDIEEVREVIERQIRYNYAIAEEGLSGNYGVGIGRCTLENYNGDVYTKMRAYTAAASEARMCGATLPVVTNSGSGNQGIAASVPLIVYAEEKGVDHDKLIRALVFSNLITVYQKNYIGRLSAFCGAISATCAALSGLAFMLGYDKRVISDTITNTLANDIGVVCDGAKSSCAAKIACGFDSALTAFFLAKNNKCYDCGCGIIKNSVDDTIRNVGRIASKGMLETDKEILDIMLETPDKNS